jgi:hypothetical protein
VVFRHADRTAGWHEVVLNGLCIQNPQMARNSYNTGAVIAVEGPGNSLWFYWNINGSPTWTGEQVAGPGTTYSAPAITDSGSGVQIAAAGPNGTLWFYWAPYGSSTWNSVEVGGPGAIAVPVPAMVLGPLGTAEIAVIGEYSHLWLYREGLFGEWNAEEVTSQGGVELSPWITRSATGTEITTNVGGYVYAYFNTDGSQTWTLELPSANRAYYGSPITRVGGGTEIAAIAEP